MKSKKKKWLIISAVFVVVILLYIWGFALQTVNYRMKSDKVKNVKIVFISDLHNCFYGGFDQSGLMDAVNEQAPDIVLFGGDVVDQWGGTEYALRLLKMIKDKYPCAYTPGNHEEEREDVEEFYDDVREIGVPILLGDRLDFDVNGEKVCVFGVLNHYAAGKDAQHTQLDECYEQIDPECYNILLAHEPEQIYKYDKNEEKPFDLVLSGHAHGGQWRLPKILEQGLYAPGQGLFPDLTNGKSRHINTDLIVSKGLAKPLRMIFIPRIFNRPELTVIEFTK